MSNNALLTSKVELVIQEEQDSESPGSPRSRAGSNNTGEMSDMRYGTKANKGNQETGLKDAKDGEHEEFSKDQVGLDNVNKTYERKGVDEGKEM